MGFEVILSESQSSSRNHLVAEPGVKSRVQIQASPMQSQEHLANSCARNKKSEIDGNVMAPPVV